MTRKVQNRTISNNKRLGSVLQKCIGCVILLLSLSIGVAGAQDGSTVSGVITDESSGDPLPGVNITVTGTQTGTTSDAQGRFEIEADLDSDSLEFSFVGYESQVVPIDGQENINVVLAPETISGEEVVVVGYSEQQRRDVTGAISSVDMDNFQRQSTGQVSKQLQGQASGVTVVSSGQPGETPDVRIRGINTFGNNSPLYVVDGVPTNDIDDINPSDISSMEVLKDASAASIYGARASNGVIIVTTEQGQGDVQVDYSASYARDVPPSNNAWNKASPQEMAELRWRAIENSGGDPRPDDQYGDGEEPVLPDYIKPAGASEDEVDESEYFLIPEYKDPDQLGEFNQIIQANKEGTDWFDAIFDPAGTMNHDLKVSGGGETGNFLVSFNYFDQQGTLMETFRERYTIRANTRFNVSDNLRIGENLAYSVSENPQTAPLTEGSAIGMSMRMQPIVPVHDIEGNFAGTVARQMGNPNNPVAIQYRTRNNESADNELFGNAFAEWDPLENLTLRTSFGGDLEVGSWNSFSYPQYENAESGTSNSYSAGAYYGYNYTWSNTLNYQETFGESHEFEITLGHEMYKNKGKDVSGTSEEYFSFDPNFTSLDNASGSRDNFSSSYEDGLLSFFGRVDYDFDDKYILSATLRRDGSSRFLNNRWGWFPAGSLGWRISEESFMQGLNWVSDFRIRLGYGIMGNQENVDPANAYTLFASDDASTYYDYGGNNSGIREGFSQSRIGNPDARWEKNITANIGFDGSFFEDRVELSAEYYTKDVTDLLYNPTLVGSAGTASPPYINIANMSNSGIDATFASYGRLWGDLEFNTQLTFTSYKNTIEKIADGTEYFGQEPRRFNGVNIIRNQVGHPVSSYYGYKIDGFWDSQDEIDDADEQSPDGEFQESAGVGRFRYADTDGDGEITAADRTFLGDPNPDFTYGINFGMNYRNWDFNMQWYGSQGNDIWNQTKWWLDFYSSFQGGKSKTAVHDSWTEDNKDATAPIQENEGNFSTNTVPNSYYVENGSYLRLKNLQLGYTIPTDVLEKIGASNLRLYVQANNLLTITNYSGLDPEVGFNPGAGGGGSTNFGIDEGSYPTSKQFLIGLSLSY